MICLRKRTIVLAAGLTAMFAVSGWSQSTPQVGETGLMPSDGLLVLRTGQVLRGRITHAGDLYYVVLPNGEIRINSAKVEFICDTLETAYARKRAAIRVGNASDHIELAQWCQQQGLRDAAARELADAQAADPTNLMIPHLERRLKMSLEPAPVGTDATAKAADAGPSLEELDHMTRSMPPGALEIFTTTIQPLLLNNCTAADCHGGRATGEFRLLRAGQGRSPSRRLTQRNLYATLKLLNREQPEASPLLTVPIQPHGTAAKEIFTDNDVIRYRQMIEWVYLVVGSDPSPTRPATVAQRDAAPVQAMSAVAGDRPSIAPGEVLGPAAPLVSDCPFDSPPGAADLGPAPPRADAPKVQRGAPVAKFTPVDPFDPAIFNRRFSPGRSPVEGVGEADDRR